jgi:hypothetical protein
MAQSDVGCRRLGDRTGDLLATLTSVDAKCAIQRAKKWSHGESNTDHETAAEVEKTLEIVVSQGVEKRRRRNKRGTK